MFAGLKSLCRNQTKANPDTADTSRSSLEHCRTHPKAWQTSAKRAERRDLNFLTCWSDGNDGKEFPWGWVWRTKVDFFWLAPTTRVWPAIDRQFWLIRWYGRRSAEPPVAASRPEGPSPWTNTNDEKHTYCFRRAFPLIRRWVCTVGIKKAAAQF